MLAPVTGRIPTGEAQERRLVSVLPGMQLLRAPRKQEGESRAAGGAWRDARLRMQSTHFSQGGSFKEAEEGVGGGGGAPARAGRVRGRSAAHLSELQGGDDQEDDASEAEAGPIPVRQAGIGLSLQELQQHGPPATITLRPAGASGRISAAGAAAAVAPPPGWPHLKGRSFRGWSRWRHLQARCSPETLTPRLGLQGRGKDPTGGLPYSAY